MNLANRLTVIRILLVPIFMVFTDSHTRRPVLGDGCFIIAAITDGLMGILPAVASNNRWAGLLTLGR